MNLRPLTAAAFLALTLAGCALTPPGSGTSTPVSSPTSPSSPTQSSPPSPSPSPTPSALVLGGTTLGSFGVGSPESDVAADITARLGEPTDSNQGPLCSLDDSSPYSKTLLFGNMWVQFAAADKKKSSPRTLSNWGLIVEKGLPTGVVMQDGVPLNLGWKQLKAKYPGAKAVETGAEGTQALRLPNKLLFTGDTVPLQVQGGEFNTCE